MDNVAVRRIKHYKNEILIFLRFEIIYLIDKGCFIQFGFAVFIIFDFKNGMFHCHGTSQRQKHNVKEAQLIFSERFPFTFRTQVCGLTKSLEEFVYFFLYFAIGSYVYSEYENLANFFYIQFVSRKEKF